VAFSFTADWWAVPRSANIFHPYCNVWRSQDFWELSW